MDYFKKPLRANSNLDGFLIVRLECIRAAVQLCSFLLSFAQHGMHLLLYSFAVAVGSYTSGHHELFIIIIAEKKPPSIILYCTLYCIMIQYLCGVNKIGPAFIDC